jgi:hypothetical protein
MTRSVVFCGCENASFEKMGAVPNNRFEAVARNLARIDRRVKPKIELISPSTFVTSKLVVRLLPRTEAKSPDSVQSSNASRG